MDIREALAGTDPAPAEARSDLAAGYFKLAGAEARAGRPVVAADLYRRGLSVVQELLRPPAGAGDGGRARVAEWPEQFQARLDAL